MAPSPLGCLLQLAPIAVPDHSPGPCGDKVPWAPRGRGWRPGGGGPCGGSRCQAELVWPVFSPPGSLWGRGGAEWAEWQAQQRGAVSSQPLPSPRPTGGNSLSGVSGGFSPSMPRERSTQGQQAGGGPSRDHAHLWETLGPGSPAQGHCLSSVIQSFSKPPWVPLKLSPTLARSPPAPSPSTFGGCGGEKKLKAAVSGWDGGGMPCRCPAVPTASGGSKGAFRGRRRESRLQGSEVGRGRSAGRAGRRRRAGTSVQSERSG